MRIGTAHSDEPCGESARRASPPGSPNRQERSLEHPHLIWRTCRPPSSRASGRGCSPGTARVTCKRYASKPPGAVAIAALLELILHPARSRDKSRGVEGLVEALGTIPEAVRARGAPASSCIASPGYRFNHYDER